MRKISKREKEGFLEIPFSWLFAIIIGAIVIFFAIYVAVKLINAGGEASSAKTGGEISVLLNPLETSFGEESSTVLSISVESRLSNKCSSLGDFGTQQIIVSQKSGGKWQENDVGPSSQNKYIFSDNVTQGKNFYLFSKPFELPFKVSDLIYLTSTNQNYCFIGAGDDINSELAGLNQGNLFTSNCPSGSIKVCFDSSPGCDIEVNKNLKTVEKNGNTVYFETDALMYGAIFSDPAIYECQIQRLMKRLRELSMVYNDKEAVTSSKCPVEVNLLGLADAAMLAQSSADLLNVKMTADDVYYQNRLAVCKLW